MAEKWRRISFVTKDADPTEVVEWVFGKEIHLQEFQGMYSEVHSKCSVECAESVHKLLEKDWQAAHGNQEENYDRLFYGGK
jgi:hypothetical protein